MGLNTAAIFRNDHLQKLITDPTIGNKIYNAIQSGGKIDNVYGIFTVLPPVHADIAQTIRIGGNSITNIPCSIGRWNDDDLALIAKMAEAFGYKLVNKATRHSYKKPDNLEE